MATTNPQHARKRRLPILVRHAVTLAAVFVIALPLSYIIGQRIIRHQQLQKLSSPDPATFEKGLHFVYNHAADDPSIQTHAAGEISRLPDDQAIELLWTLGLSLRQETEPLPQVVTDSGAALIERIDFERRFQVYDRLDQLGAGQHPRVLDALATVFDDPDDRRFLQAVAFYDSRFLWLRDNVPADAWLRWAVLLSGSEAALTQLRAAELLGDMPDALDDPRIAEGLSRLAGSTNPAVRGKVLDVAAGYARAAADPVPYEQVLIALTEDENQSLSRRAWITLGLLNPLSGFSADWRSVEPAIAEAMLWAVVKTNPDRPSPALEAMQADAYQAAGTLALDHWRQQSGLPPFEEHVVLQRVAALDPDTYETNVNRAIHVSKQYLHGEWTVLPDGLFDIDAQWSINHPHLYAAFCWVTTYPPAPEFDGSEPSRLRLIAYLDGYLHHGGWSPPIQAEMIQQEWPDLAILLASILTSDEPVQLYAPAFNAEKEMYRHLAIIAAQNSKDATDFIRHSFRDRQETGVLSAALLTGMLGLKPTLLEGDTSIDRTTDEFHAMSDAQLADLGLRRVDALTTLLDIAETAADREDRYEQIALLKLALWIRGDLGDEFTPEAERMLDDDRLPTSTVLMCLLHMQRPAALYYLFDNPDANSRDGAGGGDVYDLFVNQRWWHVFSRLVPDPDLDLWLWGDPGAQAFQFEVMRQWVQVNRWRLEGGWWPGDNPQ